MSWSAIFPYCTASVLQTKFVVHANQKKKKADISLSSLLHKLVSELGNKLLNSFHWEIQAG